MSKKRSNKSVKRMMSAELFKNKFLPECHSVVDFDFPVLTVWNCELSIEQFACLSAKTISLTASELKGER